MRAPWSIAFSRISIRWKIVAVLGLLIATGFSVAGIGMTLDYRSNFRKTVQDNVSILADVVGDNCRAALVFHDSKDAREVLRALAANEHIVDAVLFDDQGHEFATYRRGDAAVPPDRDVLLARKTVRLDGRPVGSLLIRSDLAEWRDSLSRFIKVAAALFVSVMLLTLLASTFLQRLITDALRELVATTRRISETRDYSLRAARHTEDELGELVEALNAMLAEIEHRDGELRSARDELRQYVNELEAQRGALQREIQERKHAELQLERNAAALNRSNRELEQFAYATSHDLQEPLRGIAGSLQLLEKKQGSRLDEEARTLIGFAVDGASRLKRLINGLLEFSRVNTRPPEFEPVDCDTVRKQVLADLALAISEANASVTSDPMPVVQGDPVQLPLVFQNLISNALRFRGEDEPRIHVGAEQGPEGWTFSVEDNGIGIEPRFFERIFAIFQRLHSRDKYDGTGIGLAVAKKVVERHNGRIWVESTCDRGTKFCFTVPNREG